MQGHNQMAAYVQSCAEPQSETGSSCKSLNQTQVLVAAKAAIESSRELVKKTNEALDLAQYREVGGATIRMAQMFLFSWR